MDDELPGWSDDLGEDLTARIRRLLEPRSQIFSDGFTLLGQALWTAQAVERYTRTILVLFQVHAGLGGPETINAFLAAGATTDGTWSKAQKDLEAAWPDDLVKPDGLQERITAIREARNGLVHALPDPLLLAFTGVPTDDDPLADLRQFVEDAETVMYELFAVASDLSGESTRMLVGVSDSRACSAPANNWRAWTGGVTRIICVRAVIRNHEADGLKRSDSYEHNEE